MEIGTLDGGIVRLQIDLINSVNTIIVYFPRDSIHGNKGFSALHQISTESGRGNDFSEISVESSRTKRDKEMERQQ